MRHFYSSIHLQGWQECASRLAQTKMFMWWTWKDIKHTALYLRLTALHTNTQRCENRATACRSSHSSRRHTTRTHSETTGWRTLSDTCVCVCVSFSLCVSVLFVLDLRAAVARPFVLSCPSVWPPLSLSTRVLSHVNVLHCLSFSLKPTDQWDPRVSRLYGWVFAQLRIKPN